MERANLVVAVFLTGFARILVSFLAYSLALMVKSSHAGRSRKAPLSSLTPADIQNS
jgi:hypothetical protein